MNVVLLVQQNVILVLLLFVCITAGPPAANDFYVEDVDESPHQDESPTMVQDSTLSMHYDASQQFLELCGFVLKVPVLVEENAPPFFPDHTTLQLIIEYALDEATVRTAAKLVTIERVLLRERVQPAFFFVGNVSVEKVAHEILGLSRCLTPVISFLSNSHAGLQKLLPIFEFFDIPIISPFPASTPEFHRTFSNFVSFSAPQTAQIPALVDFCHLVGWRRLAVIYSLDPESVELVRELKLRSEQNGLFVASLSPIPRYKENLSHLPESGRLIDLTKEIAEAYSQRDFTVFLVVVEPESFEYVLDAIHHSGLPLLPGVAFIASESVATFFNRTSTLLFGQEQQKQQLYLSQQDSHAFDTVHGWILISSSFSNEWEIANRKLVERMQYVLSPRTVFGLYEILLYDVVLAVWEAVFQEYPLLLPKGCFHNRDVWYSSYLRDRLDGMCTTNSSMREKASAVRFVPYFRQPNGIGSAEYVSFQGIATSTKLTDLGFSIPAYTLFNVRRFELIHGIPETVPIPIGRWKSTGSTVSAMGLSNPYQLTLRAERGVLISFLSRLAPLPVYKDVLFSSSDLRTVQFPSNYSRIPKDCVFCDQGGENAAGITCLVCERDRDALMAVYTELQHWNSKTIVRNLTVNKYTTSFCDLWTGVLRCTSPWSYVLNLEGLGRSSDITKSKFRTSELQGPLPQSLGRLRHIQELRLFRNAFSGPFPHLKPHLCPKFRRESDESRNWPRVLGRRSNLKVLTIGKNRLSGPLPDELADCQQLEILSIRNNLFSGNLPDALCHLRQLRDFDFSSNVFTGPLPACIGGKEADSNRISIPGLLSLQYLNGDNNRLSGGIPWSFRRLYRLVFVSLKSNDLSGVMADVWDTLPPDLVVDISQNPALKPPLPPSLARRLRIDFPKITVDAHMFGCPSGYRAPEPEDWTAPVGNKTAVHSTNLADYCRPCPKGTVPTADFKRCHSCPPGQVAPMIASSRCIKCPAGTYSTQGEARCHPCPAGQYSYLEGSTSCLPCPPNSFNEDIGSVSCLPVCQNPSPPCHRTMMIFCQCPVGANCSTPAQQANPKATPGWYRTRRSNQHGLRRLQDMSWPEATQPSLAQVPIQRFDIFRCPLPSNCLGDNACSPHSFGDFCHRCISGFTARFGNAGCQPCRPWVMNVLRMVVTLSAIVLILAAVVRSFRKRSRAVRRPEAVVLKVFTNWVELTAQALVLACQVALSNDGDRATVFSNRLEGIYNFIQNLDDPFFLLLPLDCVSPRWAPSPLHTGLLVAVTCPIALFLGLYSYQLICEYQRGHAQRCFSSVPRIPACQNTSTVNRKVRSRRHSSHQSSTHVEQQEDVVSPVVKRFKDAWPETVGIFIPIFFLIHPALTRQFLNNLDCIDLDTPRVVRDYGLSCNRGPHRPFILLAWVGMLLWTFGMPILFAVMLRSKRHMLHDARVHLAWGFLLDGYENRYYWWEIWAMIRKVLVDLPAVVPFLNEDLQYVCLLTLSVVSLAAHIGAQPFDNRCFKIADRLESMVLWTFLITLLTLPVHRTLNTPASGLLSRLLSKLLLSATFGVSLCFVILAVLFYVRPLLCQVHDRLYQIEPLESHNYSKGALHTANHAEPLSRSFMTSPTATQHLELPRRTGQFPATLQRIRCRVRNYCISPAGRISRLWMSYACLNPCVRRVLHLYRRRVRLTDSEELDVSELSWRDRKFLRETIFTEILETQFKSGTTSVDTDCLRASLLRIFRFRAFQDDVQKTRYMLNRIDDDQSYHPWIASRSTSLPFVLAIRDFQRTSKSHLQSLGSVIKRSATHVSAYGLHPHRSLKALPSFLRNQFRNVADGKEQKEKASYGFGEVTNDSLDSEDLKNVHSLPPDIVFEDFQQRPPNADILWRKLRFKVRWTLRFLRRLRDFAHCRIYTPNYSLTLEELQETIIILKRCARQSS